MGRYIEEHKELNLKYRWNYDFVEEKGFFKSFNKVFGLYNGNRLRVMDNRYLELGKQIVYEYEKLYDDEITVVYNTVIQPKNIRPESPIKYPIPISRKDY